MGATRRQNRPAPKEARATAPPPPKPVAFHGHWGLWQLESSCALCGNCGRHGVPRADRPDDMLSTAARTWPLCEGVYMGRPRNRCGWPKSFGWLFVPPETT